jgi:hypothetical protein
MPGPFVHLAAMQQCSELLWKYAGISVKPGSRYENMRADIELESHGYSCEINKGSIIEKVQYFSEILSGLREVDAKLFTHVCRLIVHLCTDSFSIGQISSELWGFKDDWIDVCSDFVINKKKFDDFKIYGSGSIAENQLVIMNTVYRTYKSKTKKWNFFFSKDLVSMVRSEVKFGAEFGYHWICSGLNNSNNYR